jgi:hypothetical protein
MERLVNLAIKQAKNTKQIKFFWSGMVSFAYKYIIKTFKDISNKKYSSFGTENRMKCEILTQARAITYQ